MRESIVANLTIGSVTEPSTYNQLNDPIDVIFPSNDFNIVVGG